jgi:hypothetical protein
MLRLPPVGGEIYAQHPAERGFLKKHGVETPRIPKLSAHEKKLLSVY